MKIKLELNWQKIWIGVDWEKKIKKIIPKYDFIPAIEKTFHVWINIIPCLPIHISWVLR